MKIKLFGKHTITAQDVPNCTRSTSRRHSVGLLSVNVFMHMYHKTGIDSCFHSTHNSHIYTYKHSQFAQIVPPILWSCMLHPDPAVIKKIPATPYICNANWHLRCHSIGRKCRIITIVSRRNPASHFSCPSSLQDVETITNIFATITNISVVEIVKRRKEKGSSPD